MACRIYRDRPQICRQFPLTPREILEFPDCTYHFNGAGIRTGNCSLKCNDICCTGVSFFGQVFEICPFYEKE